MQPEFRGFLYAVGQGAYLKPAVMCEAVRLAAQCGYTHFVPYLDNLMRLTRTAKAAPPCAYSADDWRAFDAAARESGVECVPSFNVIGHTVAICRAYPELAGPGRSGELDPTQPATREWMSACLEEFCGFSEARWFLAGGDEWQIPNHLLARGFDAGMLWVEHVNAAVERLCALGRTPIVWHDMLQHYPQALETLSREAVIAYWNYDEDADYPALRFFRDAGFRTIMAPGLAGNATLTQRRVRGIRCAVQAAEQEGAQGLLMTSWHDCRWEKQQMNLRLTGELLAGREIGAVIPRTLSLHDLRGRLGAAHRRASEAAAEAARLLHDPAWDAFPEYRAFLEADLAGDRERLETLFLKHHAPQSPLLEEIRRGPRPPAPAAPPRRRLRLGRTEFGLDVEQRKPEGAALHFVNADESFVVYPAFGATLQDWWVGETCIVRDTIAAFLEQPGRMPGGYRSYSAVLGFRPIWAFAGHKNPCIVWQYPWAWNVLRNDREQAAVELTCALPHVNLACHIGIRRGDRGFQFSALAVNKVPGAYGAFGWSLPLHVCPTELEGVELEYFQEGSLRTLRLGEAEDGFLRIDAPDGMTVRAGGYELEMTTEGDGTTGFFIDWSARFLTPDLRGKYRRLQAGERVQTSWVLAARPACAQTAEDRA